jgi:hypothetical protein
MPGGTYEEEVKPIRGDVFLDRILGWLAFSCALPVLGVAVYRLLDRRPIELEFWEPAWVQPLRVLLIALAIVGIVACTRSSVRGFQIAILLFIARIAGAIALYPYSGGPRFSGTELLFDLVVIGYSFIRIKSLNEGP